jgi:hypothetical protein
MNGRSLLCLSVALLASFVFATPSQAGLSQVTTTVTFNLTGGTNPRATDLEIFYSKDVSSGFGGLGVSSTGGLTIHSGSPTFISPSEIMFTFNPASATTGALIFEFSTNATGVGLGSGSTLTGVTGAPTDDNLQINVSQAPEPSTFVIFGVGLAGFFAVRHLRARRKPA